jgi:hypothetical protein
MTPEERHKLRQVATRADKEMIRSHGWEGSVEMLETLQIDEDYLKAASPAAILALLDHIEALENELGDRTWPK